MRLFSDTYSPAELREREEYAQRYGDDPNRSATALERAMAEETKAFFLTVLSGGEVPVNKVDPEVEFEKFWKDAIWFENESRRFWKKPEITKEELAEMKRKYRSLRGLP